MTTPKSRGVFQSPDGRSYAAAFFLVATLFMLWAVLNSMIDTMDKHFQNLLGLSKAQSAWVQFAHYFGYTLMALPAGLITRKIGYKGGIIFGLLLVSLGGFWFVPATYIAQFWGFLLGVCFVAMGLTVLETVANPYTTVLGPQEKATFRINLAQSFNGFGWIMGPVIASKFFYATTGGAEAASKTLYIPYLIIAIFVLGLVVLFWRAKLPEIKVEDEYHTDEPVRTGEVIAHPGLAFTLMLAGAGVLVFSVYAILTYVMMIEIRGWFYLTPLVIIAVWLWRISRRLTTHSIWGHPHFSGATISQFAYVAAQAGIFSFFINYMTEIPTVTDGLRQSGFVNWILGGSDGVGQLEGLWRLTDSGASRLLSVGFFLFFIGRVIGAAILSKASAHRVLGLYAAINAVLCALVVMKIPQFSVMAVFGTFFFMSLMFPTIFSLGIHGLGSDSKKKASAFIVMSITGGALMPKLMGRLGDVYDMSIAFLMPLGCFAVIALYGFFWSKLSGTNGSTAVAPHRHG
ncbi:MFS transporter [Opitutus terrae]|uniref:Major facilitator superfamily MFS_1 n=1 Tax=Opitutus terrae (strain DSM 11246 / JCM 15787 / PB90-1) TaxID=452637 RepID=B1ZS29_OPITP|nr:MFS transporter [Opitutus terrae]ACB74705.1 major facilitator superfamily MFS_1 [Opitutus terrae PB90-1]